MNTLFEKPFNESVLQRISTLQPDTKAQWGKMNVSQMLDHCCEPLEVALGHKVLKRSLLGMLFGGWAKKKLLNEKPFDRNMPTDTSFIRKGEYDFSVSKEKLNGLIKEFNSKGEAGFTDKVHPFFGNLTPTEWGTLQAKHLDHHLRQFGV